VDYHFVFATGGQIPAGAQPQGHEADGTPLWVARSPGYADPLHLPGIQPGKVRPGFGGALIPFGGREVLVTDYEVLMEAGVWVPAAGGQTPDGAIVCGREANGDPLFVCRAAFDGGLQPGKVRFAFGAADIGWGGAEHPVTNYEVLVSQDGLR
jgi:hypothetical protein